KYRCQKHRQDKNEFIHEFYRLKKVCVFKSFDEGRMQMLQPEAKKCGRSVFTGKRTKKKVEVKVEPFSQP
nr:hypothetical protein [Prolixibacteraceae bacterium]